MRTAKQARGAEMNPANTPDIGELWDAVEGSLSDASNAFPVLVTMLKKAKDSHGRPVDLRAGAMVADEMIANVKYAHKAVKALRAALARATGE